ncbi:RICIN domain-containing protein [Kitasatospora sp. MAP5-34]|uniref:RICIN domain-containing protein n=1 Tax=Kitasatospora sp. MAP5-34 TaxID=3035102 RepID=UPI002474CF72|nr:RICIN domain-containing protein [Kitasatospora sp. MAP5-34]MDH6580444.1 chitodextrinase [Kitasatospora sp. MAP5-34]
MTGKRAAHGRRKGRRIPVLTALAVATGLVAGVIGINAAQGGQQSRPTAAAQAERSAAAGSALGQAASGRKAVPTPAAAPQHKVSPTPPAAVPKPDPARGMVYTGLAIAAKTDPCAGEFRTSAVDLCTHGPDAAPQGVDIHATVPVAVSATATAPTLLGSGQAPAAADLLKGGDPVLDAAPGASPASAGAPAPAAPADGGSAVVCDGDGTSGNRVQVLYVHGSDQDRYAQYLASFKKWAADVDVIYDASAQQTGGDRHVRYVTDADCTANVLDVQLPDSALSDFGATNDALAQLGYNRHDRKYMMFADAAVYCGIGTFAGDERPEQANLSNFGPSYGRSDSACWSAHVAAHELGHNLGAVNNSAPYSSKAAHCTVDWDLMCYSDAPYYPTMQTLCPDQAQQDRLDCTKDDYFNTNPKPGSYLSTHWNVADNQFLITGGGTGPNPTPSPSPSPSQSKSPDPTPSPTPTGGPSTGPDLTISQVTQNSALLSWTAVPSAAGYQILLNGKAIGTVTSTVVRVVSLRPDTDYTFAVAVRDQDGQVSQPGASASLRTLAEQGATTPGKPYTMTNSFTGQVASVWSGSSNDGDVLFAYQSTGYSNQQWDFEDAGNGLVRIKNVQSGKCLQVGGTLVAGEFVFQQPCGDSDAQAWQLSDTGSGHTLSAKGSNLVLGTSNRWYYGGWLLELQQPNGQSYQNWTIQPAS